VRRPAWRFHTQFLTWLGKPTLFLEDIVVREAARGHGVGRRLLARLASIARGWGRIDFRVLDRNPACAFYQKLGFEHAAAWLRYRAGKGWLERLAEWDESNPSSRGAERRSNLAVTLAMKGTRDA
jgi:ribosomal protein S18 acetylase RimI-like enzyme